MTVEQKKLLDHIDAICFAAYDTMLFLDTHPEDTEALSYYCQLVEEKKKAVHEYEQKFEPLYAEGACANKCSCTDKAWTWATTPWPWERRGC